jgi:hypothetical protein
MRSRLLAACISALIVLGGMGAASASHPNPKGSSPAEIINTLFKHFNAHDVDRLQALYAGDAILTSPDFDKPRIGPAGVRRTYGELFREAPDIHDCVVNLVAEKNYAAVQFITRSRGKHAFMFPLATFFEFQSGKIVRDTTYFDTKSETGTAEQLRGLTGLWAEHCPTQSPASP